ARPRALLRAARRDEEGRVESEVPDSCIPDLLRGRVEDPLGRHLAGQPAADDDLALELARPPAGISEAEPVSGGGAREERPAALGRHAQEQTFVHLDRIWNVGAAMEQEAPLRP